MAVRKVDGRWQAKGSAKRPNGKTGYWHSYFKTKREATEYEIAKRKEIECSLTKMLTLNEVVEQCNEADALRLKPSTIRKNTFFYRHFQDDLGNLKMDKITTPMINQCFLKLKNKGYAYETMKQARGVLAKYFNYAMAIGIISYSPMKAVHPPKDTGAVKEFTNYWTQEEYDRFRSRLTCQKHFIRYDLLWTTGIRIGEFCGLQWKHYHDGQIDIRQGVYNGRIQSPKTPNSIRTISIPDWVCDELDRYKEEQSRILGFNENWFISANYKPLWPTTAAETLREQLESMKIEHLITPHGFRHSHASILIEKGIPDIQIAERLGHTVRELHSTYAHIYDKQKENLRSAINEIFG